MIYIDNQKSYSKKPSGKLFSHMIADTPNELIEFATKCGISRCFKHNSPYIHYDVSETHYTTCIASGAILVNSRELVKKLKEQIK